LAIWALVNASIKLESSLKYHIAQIALLGGEASVRTVANPVGILRRRPEVVSAAMLQRLETTVIRAWLGTGAYILRWGGVVSTKNPG
jgi:hypothetical protein